MGATAARMAQALREDPRLSVAEICRRLGVSETTFYRYTTVPKRHVAGAAGGTAGGEEQTREGRDAEAMVGDAGP